MTSFEQKLEKYAELIVSVGLNIQKDQTLFIDAPVESPEFVRFVVKKAYERGAKEVRLDWYDDQASRIKFELAPASSFTEFPSYKALEKEELAKEGAAYLHITSSDPDYLKGIDSSKISSFQKAKGKELETFRQYMQNEKISWTIAAAATEGWANKVFSNEPKEQRLSFLWDAIFSTTRSHEEDPVKAWENHSKSLQEKKEYLNSKRYKALHYKAKGTDLSIELPKDHIWTTAESKNEHGHGFIKNIPTEEVFTSPSMYGVNGTVSSSKPLSYAGNIIDEFQLTFKNGRVIAAKAKQGEEILQSLVDTDEGSHYLGEIALVPHDSPISNSNILFFNTLFDENASNHLALGAAFPFCLKDGVKMTKEQLAEKGLNDSLTHVDFMVGTADMDIDGELEDGTLEPIFRNGNWAF
ncbi:aminopeptidase [Bacillus carboniphilus]|uniref:Aminopeptidase n=1 Tax=Bacillus carboniphilus TaxID=86663 RepID=A0ABY9JXN2_9BACI|nr:aminopeptidase [Bacillus carboniphilus]WLR43273.1 aminopeptidase [Bacillus carboniphilus]